MEQLFATVTTSAELNHRGYSSAAISRACASQHLVRMRHNAYVKTDLWNSWDARTRCYAHHVAVLKNNPAYVLSHSSAALWWGAPLLVLPHHIRVSAPFAGARSRERIKVSSGRSQICKNSVFHQGAKVTDPVQTLIDCVSSLPPLDVLCIADFMLHREFVSFETAQARLAAMQGRGAKTARLVSAVMSAAAESPAETIARYFIVQWKLPVPAEQAKIYVRGKMYRPDFLWEEERVILEVDGEVKYSGAYGDSLDVIQREHRRQRDLEHLGYTVVRVRWRDLMQTPQRVRQWLAEAGVKGQ